MEKNDGYNIKIATRETIGCILYLLKYTDTKHMSVTQDCVSFLKDNGINARRQRIPFIFDSLSKNNEICSKLGFVVEKASYGTNNNRFRYYISNRLLTMQDINDIAKAFDADQTNMSGRSKEIIEGLTQIFPTYDDIEHHKSYGNETITLKNTKKRQKLADVVNESYENGYPVELTQIYDLKVYTGYIRGIYYAGATEKAENDYVIDICDIDTGDIAHILFTHIKSFTIIRRKVTTRAEYSNGNIELYNPDTFQGVGSVNKFVILQTNRDYSDRFNEKEKMVPVSFETFDYELICEFCDKFKINNPLEKESRNIRSDTDGMKFREKLKKISGLVSLRKFLNWASDPEIALNLYHVTPNIINKKLKQKYAMIANVMARKVRDD